MAGAAGQVLAAAVLCAVTAACSGDRASQAPAATVAADRASSGVTTTTAASTTTVAGDSPRRSAQQEVEAAYLRSWEVYAEAMLRLDPARLQDVYSGPALATRRNEIADLARLGTPGLIRVDHDYEIVLVNADAALVLENYFNHSVLLDGTTMQPIESDPNATVKREYVLERRNDDWRITRINVGS